MSSQTGSDTAPKIQVRHVGLFAGATVATVAAAASYTHMMKVAAAYGDKWLSFLLPLSVDGLLVVASLVLIVSRSRGEDPPALAKVSMVIGLAVSLAANVGAAALGFVSGTSVMYMVGAMSVSMWPPVSFAFAYELVLKLAIGSKVKAASKIKSKTKSAQKTTSSGAAVPSPAPEEAPSEAIAPREEAEQRLRLETQSAPAPAVASLHAIPDVKPDWLTGQMTAKEAMYIYLDSRPEARGPELDRFAMKWFETSKGYGRRTRADWERDRGLIEEDEKASGE